MNTKSDIQHTEDHPNPAAGILERAGPVAIFPIVVGVILSLAAGRLDWTWAWVYLGVNLANALIAGPTVMRACPPTVAEGGELKTTEKWDVGSVFYSVFYLVTMYIALPLVAGLDVRFGWTRDLSIAWHLAGAAVLAVGLGLPSWAMMTNAYIWSDVAVQRGQTVCSSGPYRFVRHPAYAGVILQAVGVPILLGSLWALIPGIAAAACMIIATSSEDRTLQAELPGYQDYARHVRFRLVPGLW
jgi:protein-S-isoprenylcysteine O-methyltransferase Ste14